MVPGTEPRFDPRDPWDVLHNPSAPNLHWSTSNIGEALPGVPTPLSWSLWDVMEGASREAAFAIGALTRAERRTPAAIEERFIRIFYGRPAVLVEYLVLMGDRLPGTSGEASARGIFGRVPDDIDYHATIRRYPIVAWRLPYTFVNAPRRLRAAAAATDRWYGEQLARVPHLSKSDTAVTFRLAQRKFADMIVIQGHVLYGAVQLLYDALDKLVKKTGVGDLGVLSGTGGAEMLGVVSDIWAASRGRLPLEEVVRRHGFHGPKEGELSSRVWREDQTPLRTLIDEYASRPDSEDPLLRERVRSAERERMEQEVLAAVSPVQRPGTRLLLRLAADRIPLRGVAKRSFMQGFDVSRAAARRLGEFLHEEGVIDASDDAFYLTAEEVTGVPPRNAKELVEMRKERGRLYEQLELPKDWKGVPVPTPIDTTAAPPGTTLEGIGVSTGVIEGVARIVNDPANDEVEPGEILVAPFTDPSWSSVMFISTALVVDIGGALSHAAIVARELGIPCVVNTGHGSRVIRSGDRLRVDGSTGTVEILDRAALPEPA
jgi:rifampicin phosphotransferase